MSVSAQALDGVFGRPAAGIRARLERASDGGWKPVADAESDPEGHIDDWAAELLERGPYRIVFDSDHYFSGLGVSAAYPEIAVTFRVQDESDTCQVQVLLTPYSYSMYFGTRG
ncbi:hydroxyisourate hydrolase [Micromonospora zamorensis]|uniref:hydroxyisourate hydrolase n=1 Tax=Micromonospora zamorensis TaxID=709883 RepID=UPI00081FC64F|nr:hydroxyisourate hydrolase [Micromonospora zamorensis]WTE89084.1 hydroxyisourate hydrolase [Micromonospora zamorensis]SCG46984.1 5-hydroxyisourate hydrolase [Micromonospora zamorensis]